MCIPKIEGFIPQRFGSQSQQRRPPSTAEGPRPAAVDQGQAQFHLYDPDPKDGDDERPLLGKTTFHVSLNSDDEVSVRSFTESVFDTGSIVSSASSSNSHHNNHVMVANFVDALVRDPSMDRLLEMATSEFDMSSRRFMRNFSRILKSYARHLRQTIKDSTENGDAMKHVLATRFIRHESHQIANLIASRYNERKPTAQGIKHRDTGLIPRHVTQPGPADSVELSSSEESSSDEVDLPLRDLVFVTHSLLLDKTLPAL